MKILIFILIFLIPSIFSDKKYTSTIHLTNKTESSPLFGEETFAANGKPISRYLGIPFAEPPIGNLRFKAPEKKKKHDFHGSTMWNANTPMSEDCLYLNIWTPKNQKKELLPVMVWIYGGGFYSGTSTLDVYDGGILASTENVIVVSMNYRTSMFGFLYLNTSDAPGNMGLWDQEIALKWIQDYIHHFGGDKDKVTLFGESSGAVSVSIHMLNLYSKNLFSKAILQSGSATSPWAFETTETALNRAHKLYNLVGCGNSTALDVNAREIAKCLRNTSVEDLLANEWVSDGSFVDFPWTPVIDRMIVPEIADDSFKRGIYKDIPLLVGGNQDESIYFIIYQLGHIFHKNKFFNASDFISNRTIWLDAVNSLLPSHISSNEAPKNAVIAHYEPKSAHPTPQEYLVALDKMMGDYHFTCSVNEMVISHTKLRGPEKTNQTWYYHFSHRASTQTWPEWMGVLHGYEINFIFGEPLNPKFNYTEEEKHLSRRFMRNFANFAKSGDPNWPEKLEGYWPKWPRFGEMKKYMNMTTKNGESPIGKMLKDEECQRWKEGWI
ncbi:unnamed protein product [Caenorhabditis angaria]|uniref:Carboxylic ester hydrolase n=1 Tax=Caenorhabditis angaria TaxID=860376 RepID=A0A9P1IE75_9PELO|nr:unnamed protein product [Caenorhabditis angaria]